MYNLYEKQLVELGYSITKDGKCISKTGKELKGYKKGNYQYLSTRVNGVMIISPFHRIQAYQKFGDKIYEDDIVVRHLDSNPLNNSWDNIEIGTHSDNMMDQPEEQRIKKASNANKKYSDELVLEIKEYRDLGHTYSEIMEKFNILHKGTVSNLLNSRICSIN